MGTDGWEKNAEDAAKFIEGRIAELDVLAERIGELGEAVSRVASGLNAALFSLRNALMDRVEDDLK